MRYDGFNLSTLSTCPKCHKRFRVMMEEQEPGFRDTEELICPYCGEIIKESMEYIYFTYPIVEELIEDE